MLIVHPLSFRLNKRHAERVWANCLRKLFSVGFIGVGGFFGWICLPWKNQRKLFLYKVFRQPFGSWTSAPKIVDVRTKSAFSCGHGGEKLFDPWAFGRKGQECPREIRAKAVFSSLIEGFLEEGCHWRHLEARCLEGRNTPFRKVRPPLRPPYPSGSHPQHG